VSASDKRITKENKRKRREKVLFATSYFRTIAIERMADIKDNSADNPGDNVHFFEGVEKLLEIWFTNSKGKQHQSDLRQIPR